MITTSLAAWAGLCLAPAAGAQDGVVFEIFTPGSATDLSADGSVIVGNTESYGTFRWTESTGLVDLGRNAFEALGRAAGTPDVSSDGTIVSATILDATGTLVTPGRWTEATGWTDLMPPLLPNGGILDEAYGSAWGMSGDGQVITGLYWRPGQSDGLAHAFEWREGFGNLGLGSSGRASRGSGVNADGSVIVGFDENPGFGNRRPAVWVNGVLTILSNADAFTEAMAVDADGDVVVGQGWDADTFTNIATQWRFDGTNWNEEPIGVLPGTFPEFGRAISNDVSADGSVIVGWNAFDFGPFAASTGFMWTAETGMVDIETYLIDNGVALDPLFDITTLTGVSDDGRTLIGIGTDWADSFRTKSFRVILPPPPAEVCMDIKPGSFPNSFNRTSNGVLPVAVCGTEELDVTQIDPASVRLMRADGIGGAVAPNEGPPGPRTRVEDVATPFLGDACDGHELEGDGIKDLSLKFRSAELSAVLELDELGTDDMVELVIEGSLLDGGSFTATDCIRLVPGASPPGMLSVDSNLLVWVDTAPGDELQVEGGFTSFNRSYPLGTAVTLTAPVVPAGRPGWIHKGWLIDGQLVPRSEGLDTLRVTVDSETTSVSILYGRRRFQDARSRTLGSAGAIQR